MTHWIVTDLHRANVTSAPVPQTPVFPFIVLPSKVPSNRLVTPAALPYVYLSVRATAAPLLVPVTSPPVIPDRGDKMISSILPVIWPVASSTRVSVSIPTKLAQFG